LNGFLFHDAKGSSLMPTITLTDRKIAGLKPSGKQIDYFDRSFPGFGVRVSQTGRKTFILMYRNAERTFKRSTLGTYGTHDPDIGLAKARELARKELDKVTIGRDPAAERKKARAHTFAALTDLYLERHAKRHKRSWRDDARRLRRLRPLWGSRAVVSIRRADVRELLEGIVDQGHKVEANRTLALIRKVLNFAVEQEWIDANPAGTMRAPGGREGSRSRVLTADELKQVWEYLQLPAPEDAKPIDQRHWRLTRGALRLRLVTAQRGREVLNLRWTDVEGAWWTIPPEISKNGLAHRVPLTPMAREVLDGLKADAAENDYLFTGIRGTRHRSGTLDNLTIADLRPHDFRRTAATLMTGAGIPRLVVAKVLNHAEKGITAVYDRSSYDSEKRVALETWERTLTAILDDHKQTTAVVPFTKGA
jgi:integrase